MKRAIIGFLLGGILGFGGGAGAMLIAFPFVFPPPEVNETVSGMSAADQALGESIFREDAPGQDPAHWGKGAVKFYRAQNGGVLMELQPNFEVGPGPNFWIYLNSASGVDDENEFQADSSRVKVAKLKSFSGSQVYALDAQQFAQAKAVTIWCESFNQYIASADIPAEALASPEQSQ